MSRIDKLHEGWMKDPVYRKEYDALEGEFALAKATGTTLRISFAPQPHASRT